MSSTYVIVLDGVIRDPITQGLREQGRTLYYSLVSVGRVAVLCGSDEGNAEYFLAANGMVQYANLVPEDPTVSPDPAQRRLEQVNRLRQQGAQIEFVVEPDPSCAEALFDAMVPVLVYLHPQFTEPAHRPDYDNTVKPWKDLVGRVEYQITERAKVALLTSDDE